jgi:hypothetical protein
MLSLRSCRSSITKFAPGAKQRVRRRSPGRGDFWILKIAHAPSDKNLSKNGSAHKGGSLCVKDVFAKKFLVPGEDSAVGAGASA